MPRKKKKEQKDIFWVAYSDLSTSLMLCFILIFLVAFFKLQILKKELKDEKALLELEMTNKQKITNQVNDFVNLQDSLQKKLEQIKHNLEGSVLKKYCKNVEAINVPSKGESSDFYLRIAFKNTKDIKNKSEKAWFKSGSYELENNAKRCIANIAPHFIESLYANKKFRGAIGQILIEGHADLTDCKWSETENKCVKRNISSVESLKPTDYFIDNLKLSQLRASRVTEFVLDKNTIFKKDRYNKIKQWSKFEQWLEGRLSATGRSHAQPICNDNVENCYNKKWLADNTKSRRIEFKLLLNSNYGELRSLLSNEAKSE